MVLPSLRIQVNLQGKKYCLISRMLIQLKHVCRRSLKLTKIGRNPSGPTVMSQYWNLALTTIKSRQFWARKERLSIDFLEPRTYHIRMSLQDRCRYVWISILKHSILFLLHSFCLTKRPNWKTIWIRTQVAAISENHRLELKAMEYSSLEISKILHGKTKVRY